jgi:hypothetical protein
MRDELILNVLYFAAALCVMYKMAWIARMTGYIPGWRVRGLRFTGALVALVILGKAILRFANFGGDATVVDVGRELALCLFLFFAIAVLRQRTGHW